MNGKRRKLRARSDVEEFMNANDLQDVEIGMWGAFESPFDPFWEPNRNHPAQQRDAPPPPPAAVTTDLVGRRVRHKFPGYGTYHGEITGVDTTANKYTVVWDETPDVENKYTSAKTKKMLVPVA